MREQSFLTKRSLLPLACCLQGISKKTSYFALKVVHMMNQPSPLNLNSILKYLTLHSIHKHFSIDSCTIFLLPLTIVANFTPQNLSKITFPSLHYESQRLFHIWHYGTIQRVVVNLWTYIFQFSVSLLAPSSFEIGFRRNWYLPI